MPIAKDQLVVVAFTVILGLAFGLGVWMPTRSQRDDLNREVASFQQEKDALAQATKGLSQWHERVTLLQKKLQGAQQYVPRHNEQGQVIRGLTKALGEFGVNQQEMVIRSTVRGQQFSVIPIVLEYESSFPVVYKSLKRIEQMPRLVRVERLSVHSDPRHPAEPTEVYLELGTFFSETVHAGQTTSAGQAAGGRS